MNAQGVGTRIQNAGRHAAANARQAVREFSPWVVWIGRLGFAAIGVVYVLIGVLAAMRARTLREAKSGPSGVLSFIAELPYGQAMLAVAAAGFVFYALWRFTQALMDTDAKGSDAKGKITRAGYAAIGVIHLGLAFSAARVIFGASSNSGRGSTQSWTAWLLAQPFGTIIVAAIGVGVLIGGFFFFYQAFSAKFQKTLLFSKMSESSEKWGTRFGRFGFSARAVVYCIIGVFLVFAAWHANPQESHGFGDALDEVEKHAYGAYALFLIAFGLASYGLFMLFMAKYRRMVSGSEHAQ